MCPTCGNGTVGVAYDARVYLWANDGTARTPDGASVLNRRDQAQLGVNRAGIGTMSARMVKIRLLLVSHVPDNGTWGAVNFWVSVVVSLQHIV